MKHNRKSRPTYPFQDKDNVKAFYYCSEKKLYDNTNWDNKSNIIQIVPDYVRDTSKSKK